MTTSTATPASFLHGPTTVRGGTLPRWCWLLAGTYALAGVVNVISTGVGSLEDALFSLGSALVLLVVVTTVVHSIVRGSSGGRILGLVLHILMVVFQVANTVLYALVSGTDILTSGTVGTLVTLVYCALAVYLLSTAAKSFKTAPATPQDYTPLLWALGVATLLPGALSILLVFIA